MSFKAEITDGAGLPRSFPGTGLVGIGGPGLMLFLKSINVDLPSTIIWLVGIVSIIALLISGFQLLWWAWHHSRRLAKLARENVIPFLLGLIAVAGLVLLAVAGVGAYAYRAGLFPFATTTGNTAIATTTSPAGSPIPAKKRLSRTDFEERRKALNALYHLVNGPIREVYSQLWPIYNDQPRLINTNQKMVFEELLKARDKIIAIANRDLAEAIRNYEIYTDIRNINWTFHHPILGTLNELTERLRGPVTSGSTIFLDSKETDKLKNGIDELGQWIEKTKDTIQKIRSDDDASEIIDEPTSQAPVIKKSKLEWNIEENPNNINFLGLSVGANGLQAHHFWVRGWNKTNNPIKSPRAYIRAENTAAEHDGLFNPGNGKLFPASEIDTIPLGAMMDITVPFRPNREPIPLATFLSKFVPFTFFFESAEASFRQTITREQIEHRVRNFQDAVNAKLITRPEIRMRGTPDEA